MQLKTINKQVKLINKRTELNNKRERISMLGIKLTYSSTCQKKTNSTIRTHMITVWINNCEKTISNETLYSEPYTTTVRNLDSDGKAYVSSAWRYTLNHILSDTRPPEEDTEV